MSSKEGVSIVICCYNSAARLHPTLAHIARQRVGNDISWEVIVVNNNSSDATVEVAVREWRKLGLNIPFRLVHEPMAGLSAARKKGFQSAEFEYVIFCDDDNWLDERYVQVAYETMKKHPEVGVLGGKIEAVCAKAPPFWFDHFKYAYAVGEQNASEGDISQRRFVWGAGMVVRKSIWETIAGSGFKTGLSGRKGASLSAGEDSELSMLALMLGYRLWYTPALRLRHFIPADRLTWTYLVRLTKGFGASDISLVPLKKMILQKEGSLKQRMKFLWKIEFLKMVYLHVRHPRRTLKGLLGKEGEPAVLWLHYNASYMMQLLKNGSKTEHIFTDNYRIFESLPGRVS